MSISAVQDDKADVQEKRAAEQALVARAKSNDYGAYEQLYRMHIGRVYALCRRLCKDQEMAEDLAQEAFILACANCRVFEAIVHSVAGFIESQRMPA